MYSTNKISKEGQPENPIIQSKLEMSELKDPYEKEADQAANQIMEIPEKPLPLQRKPEERSAEEIQMKPLSNTTEPIIQKQNKENTLQAKMEQKPPLSDSPLDASSTEMEPMNDFVEFTDDVPEDLTDAYHFQNKYHCVFEVEQIRGGYNITIYAYELNTSRDEKEFKKLKKLAQKVSNPYVFKKHVTEPLEEWGIYKRYKSTTTIRTSVLGTQRIDFGERNNFKLDFTNALEFAKSRNFPDNLPAEALEISSNEILKEYYESHQALPEIDEDFSALPEFFVFQFESAHHGFEFVVVWTGSLDHIKNEIADEVPNRARGKVAVFEQKPESRKNLVLNRNDAGYSVKSIAEVYSNTRRWNIEREVDLDAFIASNNIFPIFFNAEVESMVGDEKQNHPIKDSFGLRKEKQERTTERTIERFHAGQSIAPPSSIKADFQTGKSDIPQGFSESFVRSEFDYKVNLLVAFMKDFPSINIEIIGHTDTEGSEASNEILSTKRAQSLRKYIFDLGIDEERIPPENAYGNGWDECLEKHGGEQGVNDPDCRRLEVRYL